MKSESFQKDRAATEEKLIRAGRRLIARDGYQGASVREIAETAGVNVSLINRYFGGKEGLLLAIAERFISVKQTGDLGYPPRATLAEEVLDYLKFRLADDIDNRELARILVAEITINQAFRSRVMKFISGKSDANFRERLEALRERGEIPAGVDLDEVFQVISLFSFSAFFMGHEIMGRPPRETERLFRLFAESYSAGLSSYVP